MSSLKHNNIVRDPNIGSLQHTNIVQDPNTSYVKHKNEPGASITGRAHITRINVIRSRLSGTNLLEFRKTCFGQFLDLSMLQHQGQLMYLILSSMDKKCLGKGRLKFLINNCPMEFGPSEFFYITGLDFKIVGQIPSSSQMHQNIFNGKPNLKFSDIEDKFKSYAKLHNGDGLLVLKLSLLYVLYGLLLNRDFGHKNIDMKYFHLIDDIHLFNQFPWGRITYGFLVKSCHSTFRSLVRQRKSKTRTDIIKADAHGLAISLQIWAFEVMPNLAAYCAIHPPGMELRLPRMLRWSVNSYKKFEELKGFFTSTIDYSLRSIVPSDHERLLIQQAGISESESAPMDLFECVKPAPIKPQVNTRMRRRHRTPDAMGLRQPIPHPDVVDDEVAKYNAHRMHVIEKALIDMTRKIDCILDCVYAKQAFEARGPAESFANSVVQPNNRKGPGHSHSIESAPKFELPQSANNVAARITSPHEDLKLPKVANKDQLAEVPQHKPSAPVTLFNDHAAPQVKRQQSLPSIEIIWPAASVEFNVDRARGTPRKKSKTSMKLNFNYPNKNVLTDLVKVYDPVHPVGDVNIKAFEEWYSVAINSDERMVVELPTQTVTTATAQWFTSIWDQTGLLDNEHCDALLNLVIILSRKAPHMFSSDWTVIEAFGTQTLMSPFIEKVKERILPYVEGIFPLQGCQSWYMANKLYGIGHVIPNHWVLYEISITSQSITIYDSMSQNTDWKNIEAAFYNVRRNMPKLCESAGVWKQRGSPLKNKIVWDLLRYDHPPQQTNGFDCGILALKFFECLVTGKDLMVINPHRCAEFRQVYCAYLYNMGA